MERIPTNLLPLLKLLSPFLRRRAVGYMADYLNHRRDMRLLRQEGLEALPELTPQARRMLWAKFEQERKGVQPAAGLAVLSGLAGAVVGAAAYWVYLNREKL
jgi:hypothetical protein